MEDVPKKFEIRPVVAECRDVFSECLAVPHLAEQVWLQTAQIEFNFWRSNIHAGSRDRSSLDYRLRERPEVREAICSLLRGLAEALRKCHHFVTVEDTGRQRSPETGPNTCYALLVLKVD
jgi:hypothetical protein